MTHPLWRRSNLVCIPTFQKPGRAVERALPFLTLSCSRRAAAGFNRTPEPTLVNISFPAYGRTVPFTSVAHFRLWAKIMMQRIILIIVACAALVGCGDTIKGKTIAELEVGVFHQRFNQKRFDAIHAAASEDFRKAAPKGDMLELFSTIDRKLGPAKSWSTKTWNVQTFNFVTTVVLVVDTLFEMGQGTETFTFRVSGDKATLVGYNINSLDLMTK